jgi:alanine dehydrogenase
MRFIDSTTILSVSHAVAMTAISDMFRSRIPLTDRIALDAPNGDLLLMPSVVPSGSGVKLVTVTPSNAGGDLPVVQATYTLFDGPTGAPVAVLDGTALTTLRTASVSALYSQVLARPDASTLGIFGAGVQAESHIRAHCETWELDQILVTSRSPESAQRLIGLCADLNVSIRDASPAEVAGCDIVCGCTPATEPVVPTNAVRPGAHLNLIGAYRLDMREASADLLASSSVYIEEIEAAKGEAGDIYQAVEEGAMEWSDTRGDLSDLANGRVQRTSDDEITLFKGVGLALEDLAVATAILGI